MIDAERFVAEREARWAELDGLLAGPPLDGVGLRALAEGYRALCADLSRARGLELPDEVLRPLDARVARAHDRLYGGTRRATGDLVAFVVGDVPRQVRASWRWVLLAGLLFFLPFVLGLVLGRTSEDLAVEVVGVQALENMEQMYAVPPSDRPVSEAVAMAGFYIWNNVGIALRCFATGVFGGLGSVFFLVSNGMVIGTVFGHLGRVGKGDNLLAFTSGHAAWELLAIVLSGAAGLRLGWALLATGGLTRGASVRAAGPEIYRLVVGASFMLIVAAAIEGFWSASPVPPQIKVVFGFVQTLVVLAWWTLGGRR